MSTSVPSAALEAAQALGVSLSGPIGEQLAAYLARLLETNRAFNLTAITDPEEAWTKHILDSLTLLPDLAALAPASEVVDVGSGGGLPAIPLAIALPSLRFTLIEATGKKARFLEETAQALGLSHVQVHNERAENAGHGPLRARFAAATSRALSRLPVLLELTLPLLRSGGVSLAIKGGQADAEIAEASRALALLGGAVEAQRRTPTGVVIAVRKVAATPARYPRRPGEPKRTPL